MKHAEATIMLDGATQTRAGYVDVAIPSEVVGLTGSDLAGIAWRHPMTRCQKVPGTK